MSDASIPRREFVAGATAVAAGAALTSDTLASGKNSLYNLTHADFTQLIGQSCEVDGLSEQGTRQRGTLKLKEVVKHDVANDGDRPSHLRAEGFSLHFESQDLALASGMHHLAVGGLQPHLIHLQEMLDQGSPGRRQYEAVFN